MKLTPQAAFLYRLLCDRPEQDVSIAFIAITMSGPKAIEWTPRQQQQRVGNRVSVLNKQLARQNAEWRARPGLSRRSYRLVPAA